MTRSIKGVPFVGSNEVHWTSRSFNIWKNIENPEKARSHAAR
jgi:hypothetical protein